MSLVLCDIWRNGGYWEDGEGAYLWEIAAHIKKYGYIEATSQYSVHGSDFIRGLDGSYVTSYNRQGYDMSGDEFERDFNEKLIHKYCELYGY